MELSFLSFGTAYFLGALHAMEPGHGKTFVSAFMLGNKGSLRHVLTLGLSLAFSHTLVLIMVALVMRYSFTDYASTSIEGFIEKASPLVLLGLGVYMLVQQLRNKKSTSCCEEGHTHEHSGHIIHAHEVHSEKQGHRMAALAGFTGGLLPCPTALAAFLVAGNTGDFGQAFVFILLYVSGLVSVLLAIALLVKVAHKKLQTNFAGNFISKHAERISALLIIGIGVFYLIKNWWYGTV